MVGSFCGYTVNPGMPDSLERSSWMISSTPGRSARGLRRMKKRPVLGTTLVLLAPIEDMKESTYGCLRTMAAASRWWAIMASNEMSCAPSVKAKICPVSSSGMNPLGTTMKSADVPTREELDRMLGEAGFEIVLSRVSLGRMKAVAQRPARLVAPDAA